MVRVDWCYGVKMRIWIHLLGLAIYICNSHGPLVASELLSCKYVRPSVHPYVCPLTSGSRDISNAIQASLMKLGM